MAPVYVPHHPHPKRREAKWREEAGGWKDMETSKGTVSQGVGAGKGRQRRPQTAGRTKGSHTAVQMEPGHSHQSPRP